MNNTVRVARLKHGYDRPVIDGELFSVNVEIGRTFSTYELAQTMIEFKDEQSDEVLFALPLNHYSNMEIADWWSYLRYAMWSTSLNRKEPSHTLQLKEFGLPPKSDEEKRKAAGQITYKGAFGKRRYYVVTMMDEKTSFMFSVEREDFEDHREESEAQFFSPLTKDSARTKNVYFTPEKLILVLPKSDAFGEEITYVGEFTEPLSEKACVDMVMRKGKKIAPISKLKTTSDYDCDNFERKLLRKSKGSFIYVESGDKVNLFATSKLAVDRIAKVAAYIAIDAASSGDTETVRAYAKAMEIMDAYRHTSRLLIFWKFVKDRVYIGVPMDDGSLKAEVDNHHQRSKSAWSAYSKYKANKPLSDFLLEELFELVVVHEDVNEERRTILLDRTRKLTGEMSPSLVLREGTLRVLRENVGVATDIVE